VTAGAASDILPAVADTADQTTDRKRRRVLVLWYSQTGQLRRAAEALTGTMRDAGLQVDFQELIPRRPYPFPWSMRDFLSVFPATVQGRGCDLEPTTLSVEDYDLVVIAYTVWFLSPSLPTQGLFNAPPGEMLAGKPVVTLIACRNMWITAEEKMRRLIAAAGGRHVGTVAVVDDGPAWASFVTTPRWLLTGKSGPFLFFPRAGISDATMEKLAPFGAALASRFDDVTSGRAVPFESLDTMALDPPMVLPDIVIGRLFAPAARALAGARERGGATAAVALGVFGAWLFSSVVVVVVALIVAQLTLRPLTRRVVNRHLDRLGVRRDA